MLDLDHVFTYHAPSPEQELFYQLLRERAKEFAATIVRFTPPGPDQDAAVRHVREALMTANASIALGGRLEEYRDGVAMPLVQDAPRGIRPSSVDRSPEREERR